VGERRGRTASRRGASAPRAFHVEKRPKGEISRRPVATREKRAVGDAEIRTGGEMGFLGRLEFSQEGQKSGKRRSFSRGGLHECRAGLTEWLQTFNSIGRNYTAIRPAAADRHVAQMEN